MVIHMVFERTVKNKISQKKFVLTLTLTNEHFLAK